MAYTTIDSPKKYFEAKTYTGTGSTQSISGLSFSPDLVWIKNRSGANSHGLVTSLVNTRYALDTSATSGEVDFGTSGVTSLNSDGFTVVSHAVFNGSGNNYVSWNWDANGAGSSNTSGTISSTVSANTTSGFSIVSYTGDGVNNRTVGHGLGVTPKFIIIKNRDNGTAYWSVINPRSTSTTDTNILYLNRTDAEADDTNIMGTNLPNSTTFGIGDYAGVNVNGNKHIAYCFAEVKGFSKFGSYTGNGSTDGTFVYTGFRPAFVLTKASSSTGQWIIHDSARDTFNQANRVLYPSLSNAEENNISDQIDILSNGFKIRATGSAINGSGVTYIYMAFAENPFVSSKGIPTCAR